MPVARIILDCEPFQSPKRPWYQRGHWPAKWIGPNKGLEGRPIVLGFRREIILSHSVKFRAHVSADERYELFLNGNPIGGGSERGTPNDWHFETYDFELEQGRHLLVAKTWHWGHVGPSPCAQMSIRPGFLFAPEEESMQIYRTGEAGWEYKELGGYSPHWNYSEIPFPGSRFHIEGSKIDWNFLNSRSSDWTSPEILGPGLSATTTAERPDNLWLLRPTSLPAMLRNQILSAVVRHVSAPLEFDTSATPVHAAESLPLEEAAWQEMICGGKSLDIPAGSIWRVLLDLQTYYCVYPSITVSGGSGSRIKVGFAETLRQTADSAEKTRRNEIEGKLFYGFSDLFEPDGSPNRRFEPLWWQAGRFVEIVIAVGTTPLVVEAFELEETRYPHMWQAEFHSADPCIDGLLPIFRRTLEMCSHETYVDCPYYEQLMYVGDTRLEILQTYVQSGDDRLPKKAISLFDASRSGTGFTQARYPSRIQQTIGPFSLFWVGMVHDFHLWRNDPNFVKERMLGIRSVLEATRSFFDDSGLLASLPGWSFIDWAPGWGDGVPPGDAKGSIINLLAAQAFAQGADLEDYCGEPQLAERNRGTARDISRAVMRFFWDDARNLMADDASHRNFSEHAQALAILAGILDPLQSESVEKSLGASFQKPGFLTPATIYFSHYLFEAFCLSGNSKFLFERLTFWKNLQSMGFCTTPESPEPSRSDCHAWGAHPAFHYFASILGVRPSSPGFSSVRVTPQPGPLSFVKGSLPHPLGLIQVEVHRDKSVTRGSVNLPPGLSGTLFLDGSKVKLGHGTTAW